VSGLTDQRRGWCLLAVFGAGVVLELGAAKYVAMWSREPRRGFVGWRCNNLALLSGGGFGVGVVGGGCGCWVGCVLFVGFWRIVCCVVGFFFGGRFVGPCLVWAFVVVVGWVWCFCGWVGVLIVVV